MREGTLFFLNRYDTQIYVLKNLNHLKQKMSKSHIGKKDSEETKQKKSQSAKGRIKSAEYLGL